MMTGQNYVSVRNSQDLIEQTDENAPQTAPIAAQTSQLPDNRQQAIYDAQWELLGLVDDYVNAGYASGPIQALNELLYHWLTTPATDLRISADQNNLHRILKLTQFLTELYEHQVVLDKVRLKREVSRGK